MKEGKTSLSRMLVLIAALLFLVSVASAAVTGDCVNCHTMHNSQNGQAMTFGTSNPDEPLDNLLKLDCVGCHSSTTGDTIVTLGESRIPIVFNANGYPIEPLAGGNFYDVALAGGNQDSHGHNVYGISNEDATLVAAPMDKWGPGCTNSCHQSLAKPKSSMTGTDIDGCQACHQKIKHHGSTVADGALQTEASGWYRFLGGHDASAGGVNIWATAYVGGVEDGDWEQNPAAGHNRYLETLKTGKGDYGFLQNEHSMSAFCIGCHAAAHFNSLSYTNVWLRHPAMVLLPSSGEYAGYDPAASYDATVPVGWLDPTTPERSEAVVMCLSCHRAHGSEYADMLRWDYGNCETNTENSDCGCFSCHTAKDGVL